jgi:hypothetical protein
MCWLTARLVVVSMVLVLTCIHRVYSSITPKRVSCLGLQPEPANKSQQNDLAKNGNSWPTCLRFSGIRWSLRMLYAKISRIYSRTLRSSLSPQDAINDQACIIELFLRFVV